MRPIDKQRDGALKKSNLLTLDSGFEELVEGCRAGDQTARKTLYTLYAQSMLALCYRYTGDLDEAHDVLHDGFIKLFTHFTYRGECSLATWVRQVMISQAIDYLRHKKKFGNLIVNEEQLPDIPDEAEVAQTGSQLSEEQLMAFVAQLPEGCRTVFNLYVFEEKSHKEIAALLHIKEHTSTSQLHRAKTLLAKLIAGAISPSSGKIIFSGQDLAELTPDRRAKLGISFAFQQPIRFRGLTVRDLLDIAAGKTLYRPQIEALLSQVGLDPNLYIERFFDEKLSGGEAKRIEIALALARSPKLLIIDEPEAGLDLWGYRQISQLLRKLHQSNDMTLFIITHQVPLLKLADQIVIMQSGAISQIGRPSKILKQLQVTAQYLEEVNYG